MLLEAGHRVIVYDRRGFGQSSRPTEGYDFDTLAADLDTVLTTLDLRDVTLIGFSLGTGELARYIGTYGTGRLRSCVFIESLAPSFVKSDENPKGVDQAGVDAVRQAILTTGPRGSPGCSLTSSTSTTTSALGSARRPSATTGTRAPRRRRTRPGRALTWLDDFREDIKRIDVPTLILHGTADRILSIDGQGRRLHAALPDARYVEIEGGPHVMCVTHADEVNRELLDFLASRAAVGATALTWTVIRPSTSWPPS